MTANRLKTSSLRAIASMIAGWLVNDCYNANWIDWPEHAQNSECDLAWGLLAS